ncbi:hypothetical protein ACVWZ4_002503 [Bradyrhizobium sp. USDA 4472]
MNEIFELIAATVRWSRQVEMNGVFADGTLWYGMMCRTFLLLERILRSIVRDLSSLAPSDAEKIANERAQGRSIDRMTFGQCLAVAEMLVPIVSQRVCAVNSELEGQTLLSDVDLKIWRRAVWLRNRMAHQGPGFLDTVDLYAGRIWRHADEREPLEVQAQEIWEISRSLCASPLIVAYLALKGITPDRTRAELLKIENSELKLQLLKRGELHAAGQAAETSINEFHAASRS